MPRNNLVNATKKKLSEGPLVGIGMPGYVKKSFSSKVAVSAKVSPEQRREEILQKTQENTGIPGYFRETIDRVVQKGKGRVIASRDGNPPLVGSGTGYTRADSPKPMSMKQKSWKKPPLKGRLAEKKRYMRPSDEKYDAMRDESHKHEHETVPHTMSLQEIFMGIKNGEYDPGAVKIEGDYLYFKTPPQLDEPNLDDVKSSDIEFRINLKEVKHAEIRIDGEDKFLGAQQFNTDEKSAVLDKLPGVQKDKVQALMDKVLNKEIDGVYELEDRAPGDTGFDTTRVWGYVTYGPEGEREVAPVTGDVDLFAIMMPIDELDSRTNEAGTAGKIKESLMERLKSRIKGCVAEERAAQNPDVSAVTNGHAEQLASVAELMQLHIENYLDENKLGFATDFEFERILDLVEGTYEVISEKIKNGELGLDFDNAHVLQNFVSHAGAILQHGPETNNPNGENPDEPTLWQFQDKGGVVRTVQTLNVAEHTQLLTGQGDYKGFFNEGEAPCQTSFLKICPGWEPLDNWLGVYEMQEQAWADRFDPSKVAELESGSEGSFAAKVSSQLGGEMSPKQQEAYGQHMQKFKDFINGVGEEGAQKQVKLSSGDKVSLTDRFDQLKKDRQVDNTKTVEASNTNTGPAGP